MKSSSLALFTLRCVNRYLFIFAVYFYLQLYMADLTVVGVNRMCNVSIKECNYI